MTAVAVSFDGTRAIDAETTANWTAVSVTPTQEPDFRYQGSFSISGKVKTSETGFYYRLAGTVHNFTVPNVWIAKSLVTNKDVLQGNGLVLEIGNGTRASYYRYFIFNATTYPIAGGWQIIPIDPTVAAHRDATVGNVNLSGVDYFGTLANFSLTSKSENVAHDAIDYVRNGNGLTLVHGTAGDANGTFTNFVTVDEGNALNRWGVVSTRGGVIYTVGVLTIGTTANAAVFTDTNRVVVFPTGKFGTGFCGLDFNLANASTNIQISSSVFNGRGSQGTDDTRPDYTAIGNSGVVKLSSCSFNTFRNIDLTTAATLDTCTLLNGLRVNHGNGNIFGCSIQSATTGNGNAFVVSANPNLITSSTFVFSLGHAIEITNPGTYNTNNIFTNYGATETGNAAIYNNSGGNVTLSVADGATSPTYRNGAGANTVVIAGQVTLTVTGLTPGTEVRIFRQSDNVELAGVESSGTTFEYTYTFVDPVLVWVVILHINFLYQRISYTTTATNQSLPIQYSADRVYSNP